MSRQGRVPDDVTRAVRIATLKDRFRPSSPVERNDLFKGRLAQLSRIMAAIQELGQHVVVYGERGVGKTSLAYVAKAIYQQLYPDLRLGVRIQCSADDNFASIWQKFIPRVQMEIDGLNEDEISHLQPAVDRADDILMGEISPDVVARAVNVIAARAPMMLIIDEFDRIGDYGSTQLFADLVKMFSDTLIPVTLVIVGVADDVDGLISGHKSVERALRQIYMPRMESDELREILTSGYKAVEVAAEDKLLDTVVALSQGLPHYTHLIGGLLGEAAIYGDSTVSTRDLPVVLNRAIEEAQQSIKVTYTEAVSSTKTNAQFSLTLLAASLSEVDELGYFTPADVKAPLAKISKKNKLGRPDLGRHLRAFAEGRGYILETRGESRYRRYRFNNPLLRPFIIIKGVRDGVIQIEDIPPTGYSLMKR